MNFAQEKTKLNSLVDFIPRSKKESFHFAAVSTDITNRPNANKAKMNFLVFLREFSFVASPKITKIAMFNTQEMKYLYVTIMLIKTMLKF